MKANVETFKHKLFGEIRAINRDGKPWFVGKDVAKALGYTKTRNAIADHCRGGLKMGLPSNGGSQEMIIIPEADLYRLILKSNLPKAEAFQDWVVESILPSIRRTGGYVTPETLDRITRDPEEFTALLKAWKEEHDRRRLLEKRDAIFGNRTPYGEISESTGNPKHLPVRAYLRSDGTAKIITTTEIQLRLFDWD